MSFKKNRNKLSLLYLLFSVCTVTSAFLVSNLIPCRCTARCQRIISYHSSCTTLFIENIQRKTLSKPILVAVRGSVVSPRATGQLWKCALSSGHYFSNFSTVNTNHFFSYIVRHNHIQIVQETLGPIHNLWNIFYIILLHRALQFLSRNYLQRGIIEQLYK